MRNTKYTHAPTTRFGRPARWLVASMLSISLTGFAQASDPTLERAAGLISAHDAATAYAELRVQEPQRAGEPRFDYLLGIAALDSGHVTHAIFALERVVATRPDDHQARAELARAYLVVGESESARTELERVRGADVPEAAAAAIDRVLGLLDQVAPSTRPKYAGYAELGAGWDSNVNSATNAGQFAIPAFGGLVFDVAPGSGRTSDAFGTAAAGASVQVPMAPTWSLFGGIDGRTTLNATAHNMNTSIVAGAVGLSHVQGIHTQSAALQTNAAWISSSLYRAATGASLQWQSRIDAISQISAFAQWSRLTYDADRDRDADRSVLGAAYARQLDSSGTLAYGSVFAADERPRNGDFAHYGHRATGARLGGELKLDAAAVLFVEGQYEIRRYGGTEPLFDTRRIDHQLDLLAGVRFTLASQWQLITQIRRTSASSNVVLYDYDRNIIQLSLRREFK